MPGSATEASTCEQHAVKLIEELELQQRDERLKGGEQNSTLALLPTCSRSGVPFAQHAVKCLTGHPEEVMDKMTAQWSDIWNLNGTCPQPASIQDHLPRAPPWFLAQMTSKQWEARMKDVIKSHHGPDPLGMAKELWQQLPQHWLDHWTQRCTAIHDLEQTPRAWHAIHEVLISKDDSMDLRQAAVAPFAYRIWSAEVASQLSVHLEKHRILGTLQYPRKQLSQNQLCNVTVSVIKSQMDGGQMITAL